TNTICVGSSTTLTASGASSYTWTNGPNTSTNTVSPISNATYTVTGTDANNCINAATQNVIVNSLPIINISGINTICVGSSTTLTANGATSYTWTNGPNTSTNTVSPMSNATYTVTGTDANNCVNTAIQNVTVNFLPIINISDTNTICAGDTTTLTANGALFYVWSNNTNMANTTVSPASNTTYTVIGTDANNCSNSSSILIHVNPLPVIVILGTSSICIGQSTTISAIGATTYTWSGGSNTSSINISPTSDTNYVVTGTDINNCVNTATQTITVNLPPTITINGANSTCIGQSTTLSATGANTYTWTAGPGTAINIVTPLANTVYTVTGTDINNCVNTALHNVTIKSLPTISINGLTTICSGQTTTLTASGANTYVWSNGPTVSNDIVSPTVNTTYTVTGTDTNNCTNSALQLVTATPLPNVVINQGETNITSISGSLVTLEASGAVNYQWTSGNVSCTTCASITESPVANVQYCVTGTNSNNCSNNSCINILVQELCGDVFVPDAFSPNGDGVNDLFKVCGNCINKLTLQIFDRWGNKIFETTDPLSGWNGSVQGSEMNTGTYLYQANYTLNSGASSKMHGNFILIR
ncbi:MAG TPA: gliding motility-associated C-terminal domain-containing protein, partial [Bacteroidia bacterium]|nr:gliding motility-associated C-terminal domain-containing protein [Bacteroidia bacterium]